MSARLSNEIILPQGASVDALSKEIASRKGAKVLKVFDTDVFKGVSVEAEEDNIDTLHAMQAVSKAWKSNKIKLAPHIPTQSFSDDASASIYTVHNWTGVDRLHDAGIKGKGAVVAIVDTGIWYPHPDVGRFPQYPSLEITLTTFSWVEELALGSRLLAVMT